MSFKVAAVFSNNCVLQREKNIDIFGTGDEEFLVKAVLSQNKTVLAENESGVLNGRWKITLPPQSAAENCELFVECFDLDGKSAGSKTFLNIAIGEVWLCGGQSNMEFELQNCAEGPDELKNAQNPNVRFYYTNKIAWMDDSFFQAEENTSWQTWDSEWKKSWSAVGYFFAKKLASELGVTVGLVGCNWGGTSASAWMHKSYLEKDSDLKTYLDEQEEATKGKSIEEQIKEYDDYLARDAEWNKRAQEVYKEQPDIEWDEIQKIVGKNEWPGPRSCKNPFRPCGLYECMLQRIAPYTMKGVLWYQGESDDHKPNMYAKLFSAMIDNWRTDWNDDTLPFIFVQLPGNRYRQDKDFKHWCLIREAQEKVSKTVANTYMMCALDLGDYNDIHPKSKQPVGERMEKIALREIYARDMPVQEVHSPVLKWSYPAGNKMVLTFENAPNGFITKADDKRFTELKSMEENQGNTIPEVWTGFEMAGADGKYFQAFPEFEKNQITLTSPNVPKPVAARYSWFNYSPVTVYNKEGLPLAPFRTNKNDVILTEHAEIQQTMVVATK